MGLWFLGAGLIGGAAVALALLTDSGPATPDFQRLVGKWQRPGEKYVLEVRSVAADGQVEARYFNPKPINVARARATRDAAAMRLTVEMQDVGYEGSTYTLSYDADRDELHGTYFLARSQETIAVRFERRVPGIRQN
jgi:hypothetical protein